MDKKASYCALVLLGALILVGCDHIVQQYNLSADEIERVRQVQNPFGEHRLALPGRPGHFVGLHECTVYRSIHAADVVVGWEPLALKSILLTGCTATVTLNGAWVEVTFCGQLLGFSKQCDKYRTTDGDTWYVQQGENWQLVETGA